MKKKSTLLSGKFFAFLFLSLSFIFMSNTVLAQPVSQTFNSSGTYTIPTGYSANVTIQAWGGGGGGSNNQAGGGGGGGAYSFVTTTLGAGSYIVIVGTGGTAGNAGGNSSFTSIVVAGGGGSSATNSAGTGGIVITGTGRPGGAGGGTNNGNASGGGGGGSATPSANGGNGNNGVNGGGAAGGGGGIGQGNGGAGANNSAAASAAAGTSPGSGGGGRSNNGTSTAAAGANGRVIVTVNTVLPVKLSNIKAFEKQTGVQIEWTAYSEENLSKYQIERSVNGSLFTAIGEVTARNSLTETKYDFFDSNPLQGVNFYRLKSIDIDAKYGLSNIVKINLDKRMKDVTIYPNPVIGSYISFQSADLSRSNYSVKIFNTAGQQVYNNQFTHNGGAISQSIQLPIGIKSGMYSFQLDSDAVKVMSKIFMIQ